MISTITFFVFSNIFVTITSFFLGIVVFLKNRKSRINALWALAALSIGTWSYGISKIVVASTEKEAWFWNYFLYVGAIFIPIFFYHFVVVLLELEKEKRISLKIGYALAVFFQIANYSKYFVKGVPPKLIFQHWVDPGILYYPFFLFFAGYFALSAILLFKHFSDYSRKNKDQIKYVLLAILIGAGGGITNFFPQLFGVYPFGTYLVIFYVVFISYAILRHHLFNVKVIATETLTFTIWLFLLIKVFLAANAKDQIIDGSLLALVTVFGILLIRSVTKEVEQREKMEKLAVELEAANERLRQLDEAKSEFLSIASHQLRTPLTSIKGLLSMLQEGFWGPLNEDQKKYVGQISQSSERLLSLIEDLLNISRIEAGRMQFDFQPVSLESLVEDVVKELETQATHKNLSIKLNQPAQSLPKVSADSLKLRQVIQNLIDNAIKYTEKGGLEIDVRQEGKNIVFSSKDTGMGLPPGQHLFEKFERGQKATNQHTEGLGLGLYLGDKIIKAHGGKIWAESEGEDKGSTFFFSLPIII